jgi:hypothetical protein
MAAAVRPRQAGGIVVWRIAPDGGYQSAAIVAKIYLSDMNHAVLDSLYLNNGSVTHTFAAPGAYRFAQAAAGTRRMAELSTSIDARLPHSMHAEMLTETLAQPLSSNSRCRDRNVNTR